MANCTFQNAFQSRVKFSVPLIRIIHIHTYICNNNDSTDTSINTMLTILLHQGVLGVTGTLAGRGLVKYRVHHRNKSGFTNEFYGYENTLPRCNCAVIVHGNAVYYSEWIATVAKGL